MKIEIDIPDRAKKTRIYVFGGGEMLASKEPDSDTWDVVEEGCNRCGKCCDDCDEGWIFYDPEKGCKHLEKESEGVFKCGLGPYRPFGCASGIGEEGTCSIKTRKVIKAQS